MREHEDEEIGVLGKRTEREEIGNQLAMRKRYAPERDEEEGAVEEEDEIVDLEDMMQERKRQAGGIKIAFDGTIGNGTPFRFVSGAQGQTA